MLYSSTRLRTSHQVLIMPEVLTLSTQLMMKSFGHGQQKFTLSKDVYADGTTDITAICSVILCKMGLIKAWL